MDNIREVAALPRVTVGLVIDPTNHGRAAEVVRFALSPGVHDVRGNPAAQFAPGLPAMELEPAVGRAPSPEGGPDVPKQLSRLPCEFQPLRRSPAPPAVRRTGSVGRRGTEGMSIAVYSDIHGNPPGLKAVHGLIDRLGGIDREIRLEDVLYGPLA